MHRLELLELLNRYRTNHMEEAAMVDKTRRFVLEHEECFDRSLAHGHVTGSAWVVNPARTHALMLHHRKLDRWFQPGGHADGDADVIRVALRETAEEAGVDPSHVRLVSGEIFDVDIHTIYPSPTEVRHQHYDVRFLLEMDDDVPLCGNDESHEVAWIPLAEVPRFNNDRSAYRMVQKTRRLAG
jgi:8-oxo-dGTP pyrophosphatase MutT (NUDIX family)